MSTRRRNYTDRELGYPTETYGRIPSFANREEEAAFWDTHDLTEFDSVVLHPIEVTIGGDLAERLTVRLDQDDRQELQRLAKAIGEIELDAIAPLRLKRELKRSTRLNSG